MPQEHTDRLFDDVLVRYRYAVAARHPGPQRKLIEQAHELVRRQQWCRAVQLADCGEVSEIAHETLGEQIHHGRELLRNPRELAGTGDDHAQEAEICWG